ncbi:glycerophosphodiester phosphodiesterase, partial [Streptomyces sp. ZEA17I]
MSVRTTTALAAAAVVLGTAAATVFGAGALLPGAQPRTADART